VTFFFDNCISPKHVEMLRVFKQDVCHLGESFSGNTPDEVWIPEVAKRGWVLVTIDRNIKARPHERLALQQSKLTSFFLIKGFESQKLLAFAAALLDVWPHIVAAAEQAQPGSLYSVTFKGKVEPIPFR